MKSKVFTPAVFAVLAGIGTLAWAQEASVTPYQQPSVSQSQSPANQIDPFGYIVAGNAERTIDVDQHTRYLNVTRLETVRIRAGAKTVTWNFDTLDTRPFALSKILPGFENVTVYVSESPLYVNG